MFTIITLNSFSVDYLSPFHLVVPVSFYLVLSFAKFFSVVSFCITFCVCGLLSRSCRIIVPLASGVCPWWVRLLNGIVKVSFWEVLVPAFLWVELGLVPLMCRVMSRGVF